MWSVPITHKLHCFRACYTIPFIYKTTIPISMEKKLCILTSPFLPCYLYFFPSTHELLGQPTESFFYSCNFPKGVVHPKTVVLFQTSMNFFLLLNTKEDILKNKTIAGSRWPQYYFFFPYYISKWLLETVWIPSFFVISSHRNSYRFVATLERVNDDNFHFWVNY